MTPYSPKASDLPRHSFMKIVLTPVAIIFAFLSLSSCHGGHSDRNASDNEPPAIDVARAFTDSVTLYHSYPATLAAMQKVDLVARVNGYLRTINYKGGDLVEKGAVLFTIESQPYADAVKEAEAQLANARSSYDYSSRQYAAMKKALESDAVSQMEVLQAKNSMEAAEAAINQAEAALQTARTNLGYCTVRAPFRGHVSNHLRDVGAYLSGAGAPVTLATIYDDSSVNVEFYIEDGRLPNLSAKDSGIDYADIPVTFSETVSHPYTASLYYLDPAINQSTGTLLAKANIKNPEGELRDGMYATVKLPYASDPKAVLVNDAAISTDQLGKFLYTVTDSGRVVYTPVEIGDLYNDTLRVINNGIAPGTMYVTKALLKVRDNMIVKPVVTSASPKK